MSNNASKILDDISKIATNATGVLAEGSKAFQDKIKDYVKHALEDFDVATKEEVEVLKEMTAKIIVENDELRLKVAELEKHIGKKTSKKAATKKTSTKKPATKAAKAKKEAK